MVNAALDGSLAKIETTPHPVFNVHVPVECPGVPSKVLSPRDSWDDRDAYDNQSEELARLFITNFEQFADGIPHNIADSGPQV